MLVGVCNVLLVQCADPMYVCVPLEVRIHCRMPAFTFSVEVYGSVYLSASENYM